MSLDWPQALAWRLQRQFLDSVVAGSAGSGSGESVSAVVSRLGVVPAQHDHLAELAVRIRLAESSPGEVTRALASGQIIKTFAFRGATQFMTPDDAGVFLALRASSRMWELPSWQSFYRLVPADWPALRAAVREALADGPLTWDDLGATITAQPRYRHLADSFVDRSATFLKPFAWQGDLSFGPSRDGKVTFQSLDGTSQWAGLLDIDEAGRRAVEGYFRAYGPATIDHLHYWLGGGLGVARKRIRSWITDLGDRLVEVDIEGGSAVVLSDDLQDLRAARPVTTVRLLPGYDQWVMGPGTADHHVVPADLRPPITRGANLIGVGGVVSGTWSLKADTVVATRLRAPNPLVKGALTDEVARLGVILGRPLGLDLQP